MKITTATVVPKNAHPGTTVSATTSATQTGSYPVSPAGRGSTAKNRSALKGAVRRMATAPGLENVFAEKVGRVNFALSAENTQPANMALASSHGSAIVKRAGVDSSVTKI